MTTNSRSIRPGARPGDNPARAKARDTIGQALIGDGSIATAFDALEQVLRRYRAGLTVTDLDDVRAFLLFRMGEVCELLIPAEPQRIWTDE